ncbi:MAG: acetyl-CoA carboxylase biotin carboxyl carrier protein subunit [Tannerellaceae bacterium]|jgi:biotin carboxyl carrier protein|nr:acetyl-CoA carboxylase biotin carboxyl carrier protein subunit [Tannerellaceae bacterium]
MENEKNLFVDFAITVRKYKTMLTNKYRNRPVWNKHLPGEIVSALPGTIVRIEVKEGQEVADGDLLMTLDAMKMQNRIITPVAGIVREICVQEGDRIGKNHLIAKIETK